VTKNISNLVNLQNGIIDRSIFTDREIYEQELARVFARCWLYLGHESQIPNSNDFFCTYMGEDPVILTRDEKGEIKAFLNLCTHRGNRVCRVDRGNTKVFTCSYHGWTFKTDGNLVGVPFMKEGYYDELETNKWGLVSVAQIDSYKGLIFATFDREAPPLVEYLGNAAGYLDLLLDRREGGTELIAGMHRWVLEANWKFAAENFAGDGSHGMPTHGSALKAGFQGPTKGITEWNGYSVALDNGHGITGWAIPPDIAQPWYGQSDAAEGYLKDTAAEMIERTGKKSTVISPLSGNIFPNLSLLFNTRTLRVWHPRGPDKIEIWEWTIVDKNAPAEVKDAMRRECMVRFGPTGTWEQDDMDNWIQATKAGRGYMARQVPLNYQMGIGHQSKHEDLEGEVARTFFSESNHRNLYQQWTRLMEAESWHDLAKRKGAEVNE
jgi:phenylpropionate dioxygenase-like ring-hydroxylating dioxygenase large terminal subunit